MNDDNSSSATARRDACIAAALSIGVIVAGFLVYWSLEIQAVREMLELAYG